MADLLRTDAEIARWVTERCFPKPAPTEQTQRAAYAIHGACADILQAVNTVTDYEAAMQVWELAIQAELAVSNVASLAQAKAESISRGKR